MSLKCLHNITPYEKLFTKPPLLTHLKTFGCLCYVSTIKVNKTKFDPRAQPAVFIGYSATQNGYKVFLLSTKQVIVSRDIVFHERHFPFHLHSQITHGVDDPIFIPATTSDVFDEAYPIPPTHNTPAPSPTPSHTNDVSSPISDIIPSDVPPSPPSPPTSPGLFLPLLLP